MRLKENEKLVTEKNKGDLFRIKIDYNFVD